MCNKAVDEYSNTFKFVPDRCKTQEMCDESVNICSFIFNSVLDQFKTGKICVCVCVCVCKCVCLIKLFLKNLS